MHSSLLVDSVCTSKSIKAAANDRQGQSLRPDELITPTDMALQNILRELLALALLLNAVPSRAQGTDELWVGMHRVHLEIARLKSRIGRHWFWLKSRIGRHWLWLKSRIERHCFELDAVESCWLVLPGAVQVTSGQQLFEVLQHVWVQV